jgi:NhaP-type Na+/H+ or K+/H+ antiporter
MAVLAWTMWLMGVVLVLMALAEPEVQRLPMSASLIYLLIGWAVASAAGPLLEFDPRAHAPLLQLLTEWAVLISLFAVGLRLGAPAGPRGWRVATLLATVGMLLTNLMLVGVGVGFGLSVGSALLLASVLAPTDPVLASDVQVDRPGDRDNLRFSLTGEGGLNDGAAFPFVMLSLALLGLHNIGPFGWRWWTVDVLWASLGGLLIGWGMGLGFSRAVVHLRRERHQAMGMESFLTLGLIALTYAIALRLATYGFLAVFAAGLAMRYVEYLDTGGSSPRVEPDTSQPEHSSAYMANTVLNFTLDLERLAELAVMLVIGSLLSLSAFSVESIGFALLLMFVVRPIAVLISTSHLRWTPTQTRLAAWFGVRGIGSMYYLAYAVVHGATHPAMGFIANTVLVTITLSVALHGSSATPIMDLYRRARRDAGQDTR